ncbi:hypothetical protein GQ44DRAFT_733999 [Phaeosphaeriaceae sp. PMI808]|nr:hypothetical protein GQ44DRAFT_733999 [Phaeosphaeriaceae sp. PMI808]
MVKQVAFGKYKGKPAALLAFSFTFRSGDLALRFKKALVKITFDKQPGSSEDSQVPEVQNWAPRKIYGVPNDEEKTWSYCLELQGSIPIGPAQPGLTGRIGSESAFKKAHRMSIIGKRWSSPTSPLLNIAYWEVREQGKTKYGIPDELHVATIVHHEGPFQASVEVTADTPLKNDLFAFPWPKDDPILFHVGKPKGQELAVSDFGLLKDTDWLGLVPWDQEWEVNKI